MDEFDSADFLHDAIHGTAAGTLSFLDEGMSG